MTHHSGNIDSATVRDFGREWQRFDQTGISGEEWLGLAQQYFAIFPWTALPKNASGFDAGCGSGRWAALVAPRVGHLYCIDASAAALDVARRNLDTLTNVTFAEASLDSMPLADGSMDFGYSLGVLHHLPDPASGLAACVKKLKVGAPMLIYIYYAFDNRPVWFRCLWPASDLLRQAVSRLPFWLKSAITDVVAALIYWPLARAARMAERVGCRVNNWPLTAYRSLSFYSMRTDALDRFGTRLEHRMTQSEIKTMMEAAGLRDIRFSDALPFWCAIGLKV